jgi:hypothetical protein
MDVGMLRLLAVRKTAEVGRGVCVCVCVIVLYRSISNKKSSASLADGL